MSNLERKYYRDINYKPYLFYVVFKDSKTDLKDSGDKHHVDKIPEKIEIISLNRKEHNDYISGFFAGQLGKVLEHEEPALFQQCRKAEYCVILRGEIQEDKTLDYMKNMIDILQSFVDDGAIGILDLFTFSLFAPDKWSDRFFEKDINAQNHVVIFLSEQKDMYWLHTRGMIEFGRPDLSFLGSDQNTLDENKAILDQMIYYSGEGAFFEGESTLQNGTQKYKVLSEFIPDWDNDDFNNAHIDIKTIEKLES